MSGFTKLVFWLAVLTAGYFGLDYVKVHTRGDVVAYKRFAKALLQNDYSLARQISNDKLGDALLSKRTERNRQFGTSRVLFTYHEIVGQYTTNLGNTSRLIVDQVSRVDSKGNVGFWGDKEIRIRHVVELEQTNHVWKVKDFSDPAML